MKPIKTVYLTAPPLSETLDFSLIVSGPLFQLCAACLNGDVLELVARRVIVLALIMLPLLALLSVFVPPLVLKHHPSGESL